MAERWLANMQANAQTSGNRYARASYESVAGLDESQPTVRRSANRRHGQFSLHVDTSPERNNSAPFRTGNERLYEAYNELHALAQEFGKTFDAPAILVVGHQTDGKSALIEAILGFQCNHVGGGTKTRRPITLHMKYNSSCVQPSCTLVTEENGDQQVSLEELQEHIEAENGRLEREQQFWAKEIIIKIEYKFCPNLTIIDTPGLISAAPGRRNGALQNSAKQVEAMVQAKMACMEYIILCLEDTSDWSNATTRRMVMQVDPHLARTVVVSTKLDTRLPQFGCGEDVEMFLRPPGRLLEPGMLSACPFFTSVPSGRVGAAKDAVFRTNEAFREAVAERENVDVAELEGRLDRKLDRAERSRVGVTQLRRWLEKLLQRRYLENVPTIVPLLEKEYRMALRRLEDTQDELSDLHPERLKDKGRVFRETFLGKLGLLLRGTVAAPPERFGETIEDERIRGGAFVGLDGKPVAVPEDLPNANMRLFGGAQYHRAMAEFRSAVGVLTCPDISREEIVNACGIDDFHDGVNYTRTACVIAVSKARDLFEPFLHQLGFRLVHILRRLMPAALYLLQRDGQFLTGHDLFLKRVGASFHAFIEGAEKSCRARCQEDLLSTTRYVTWSLHTGQRATLKSMLSKVAASQGNKGSEGSVMDVLEQTLWNRSLGAMSEEIVAALVCQIFEGIRDQIVQSVELKFNCFFLMPVIDAFPTALREELEAAYEEDIDDVFDVGAVRSALDLRLKSLESELHQVERLQRKFASIHSTLSQQPAPKRDPPGSPRIAAKMGAQPRGPAQAAAAPAGPLPGAETKGKPLVPEKLKTIDLNKAAVANALSAR